ncbi:hypothetical protein SAMN00808754_1613 [Thermanaeromonas toyohensis ToBE]|uniref:Uncharacterized protein n=1 Tax=Thermanaeromonas toyohensis ToBE TaxID=698762 RepID=A0A1W1VU05_9FIRM|nr:hypothetical protein SAMN00808754_1613 [Thermanaeromonas toyohensis ToBE]
MPRSNFLPGVPIIGRLILSANTFSRLKYYSSNTFCYSSNTLAPEVEKYCYFINFDNLAEFDKHLLPVLEVPYRKFRQNYRFLRVIFGSKLFMHSGKIADFHRQFQTAALALPVRARPAKVSRARYFPLRLPLSTAWARSASEDIHRCIKWVIKRRSCSVKVPEV